MGLFTVCLHWFNPLIWVFWRFFLSDAELACDESVLHRCGKNGGPDDRKAYAAALLDAAEVRSISRNSCASALSGGAGRRSRLRTRIERILSYRTLSVFSLICFTLLFTVIACILLTNIP